MDKFIVQTQLILLAFSLSIITVETIICENCDLSKCDNLENCLGGHTPDPCGCCPQCARVVNETCGGQFGSLGTCDQGLTCVITPANGQPITGYEVGICLTTNRKSYIVYFYLTVSLCKFCCIYHIQFPCVERPSLSYQVVFPGGLNRDKHLDCQTNVQLNSSVKINS